ncbi:apoptosis facilitator Bcl-2-like protein 14 isoform X2 [Mixophyes fleayi]|uniref:apoptosis facilitator Bcl-2-like protein 14 isoform X2 n=1 Tax=Mixophyes fleayi TaxID=3061075 RepID=UPI003F4DA7B6
MVSVPESAMDEIPLHESEENTMEFRVLMAYAQRTLPASKYQHLFGKQTPVQGADGAACNGEDHKGSGDGPKPERKKKKKSLRKRFTPKCLRAPSEKKTKVKDNPDVEQARSIVNRIQDIIQRIAKSDKEDGFRGLVRLCSVQPDGDDEDELIANIVEILRSTGDKLNEEMTQEQTILQKLRRCWSYGFFSKLTEYYLSDTAPAAESVQEEQTNNMTKIALCIDATTKLTALDNQPMNKVLGFGVRYLKENYSPWIESQGGWEKVMGVEKKKEEEEEVE